MSFVRGEVDGREALTDLWESITLSFCDWCELSNEKNQTSIRSSPVLILFTEDLNYENV